MKKEIFKSVFFLSVVIFLSGCIAQHSGYMPSTTALTQNNFNYTQKHAMGTATATYIFGIGGVARQTLVGDALRDLMRSHQLQDGQALANITVNFKRTYYVGVVTTVTCIITADIVQFDDKK